MTINDKARIRRAFANPASIGSNTILAAQTNYVIKVTSVSLIAAAANTVTLMSAATDISADWAIAANGGAVLPYNRNGWFETVEGEALNIDLTAATQVGVNITYELVG